MAFFQLILKAKRIKKARRKYHEEKLRSIDISQGKKVHYTLAQRIRRQKILLKRNLVAALKRCTTCLPENSWLHKKIVLLRTDGTLENYVLKSICGFFAGVFLTYMFFVFFVFQLHFALTSATVICSIVGIILTLGLAFSPRVRCIVFLFLPQFFSKRGRQALMAYALILTLGGPAKNALHNVGVLSESLSCGQEHLKEAVKAVIDLVKQPFYALRDSLSAIVKSIKAIVLRIKKTLIAMKRLVLSILRIIKSVFDWLTSVVSICNKRLGTPYDRCRAVFEEAVVDCKDKLGTVFAEICNITYVAGTVCYALKPFDFVCVLVDFASDAIIGTVRKRLRKFTREMKAMFYVKIKFSHSFHMETNKSRSFAEMSGTISKEIKTKTDRFLSMFDWVGFITSFLFLVLLMRVIYYRYKWLTSDRFDNRYISGYMREIDLKRARDDKETIFPLNRRERNKYVPLTSMLLIKSERIKLAKSAVFLATTSVKLAIHMAVDYCLFWILDTIRYHGQKEPKVPRPSYTGTIEVKGQGFLADMYRSVVDAFTPNTQEREIEGIPCLPEPMPPDYDVYTQIATLVLFCWLMAVFEPYGLRLRHVVLNHYYPDRAKQRAVWLYNHIMRSRGSFLKYARRQLRRQFGIGLTDGIEKVTLRERIWAVCPLLNRCWPLKLKNACLVCGSPERDKAAPHVRCPTPGCAGVYCPQCFQDLRKMCTICKSPLDYGDLTDMSEEKDSSENEIDLSQLKLPAIQPGISKIEEKIAEEKLEEALEVADKDTSDDDTSSKYSYTYQKEPSTDTYIPQRSPFKDVEAQEIRDDVTMQIFSEPCDDVSSSDGGRVFCFGLVKQKKSGKSEKKSIICVEDKESDSTSIADTESWATEEITNREEEVLDIEIEDFDNQRCSEDELLPDICKKKAKHKKSRIKRIFKTFGKLFSFSKTKEKLAKQFQTNNYKDSIQTGVECDDDSTSSSALSVCNESHELLILPKSRDESAVEKSFLRKRSSQSVKRSDDDPQCICKEASQSDKNSSSKRSNSRSFKKYGYPNVMKFQTKKVPKHMKSVCSSTKYYEVDESSCYSSPRDSIQLQANVSTMTNTRSSVDSDLSRERRSSTDENGDNDSYIYTSGNSEKRYETHSETSDSSIPPEEFEFSEFSTEVSDDRKTPYYNNERDLKKDELFSEEDKINEDSDEKSLARKAKTKPQKFVESNVGSKLFNIKDKFRKKRRKENQMGIESNIKEIEKISRKIVSPKENSDVLRKDEKVSNKVDKETANAKKKYSLTDQRVDFNNDNLIQKVDKSVGIQADLERRSPRARRNERMAGGALGFQEKTDYQKFVRGFQPIILQKDESVHHRCSQGNESMTMKRRVNITGEHQVDSPNKATTRDQGTYVRQKSKKCISEQEVDTKTVESTDD